MEESLESGVKCVYDNLCVLISVVTGHKTVNFPEIFPVLTISFLFDSNWVSFGTGSAEEFLPFIFYNHQHYHYYYYY